jgi:hypothetical protein
VDRLPGAAVPHDRRLALVGDADAASAVALILAFRIACRATASVTRQISSASCSTQPGFG